MLGNVLLHPDSLGVFLSYAGVFGGAVLLMFLRIQLLELVLLFIRAFLERLRLATNWIQDVVGGKIASIRTSYPSTPWWAVDLRIDFLAVKGKFGPEFIDRLSRRLHVPKNYMFIGTPGDHVPHRIEALGGVRVIL